MTPEYRLLAKLWSLLQRAKSCPCCLGPECAFDGDHLREYERVEREIVRLFARGLN